MKYTNSAIKTQKEFPSQESSKNSQFLIKAGFINKEMAGTYTFLPMGLKVLRNIEQIIREEMENAGVEEILMPTLSKKENFDKTNRWDMDILFKTDCHGNEIALAPTHEEIITPLIKKFLNSPKDFPKCLFQIQNKFRNEPRAKSGLLRGREFLMKDAYSFHLNEECFAKFYEKMKNVYHKIYDRLGIGEITKYVYADGGDFSEFSHEFQSISEMGEDEIFYDKKNDKYMNKEIMKAEDLEKFESQKAVEVGNIFPLSTKFSKPFDFKVDGKDIIMGCYGIGVSRIMGVLVELFADEKGLIWNENVSPYKYHLIGFGNKEKTWETATKIYEKLGENKVFFDDRRDKKIGFGQKMGDAELIGIPNLLIISDKLLEDEKIEIRNRKTGQIEMKHLEGFFANYSM